MPANVHDLIDTMNSQGGRFGCFSENFYTFIREKIGIVNLQTTDQLIQQTPQRASVKIPTFEERQARVEKMIQRAELEDDKLEASEQSLGQYSREANELALIVKMIGQQKDLCNKEYIARFFKSFFLERAGIERLDAGLLDFLQLEELDLSHNKIRELDYLPPNLKILNLTANSVISIKPSMISESLIHLGLAYNPIDDEQLSVIKNSFPNLFSLDLAYSKVRDMRQLMDCVEALKDLKMLNLRGCPVSLSKNYRTILKQRLQDLKLLDGIAAFTPDEESMKKKKKKTYDAYGVEIQDTSSWLPIESDVTFELCYGLLQNATGMYLLPENLPADFDLTSLTPEQKCSSFWISLTDHNGNTLQSEKRYWLTDFNIDKETGTGKCDLKFQLMLNLPNGFTEEVHKWLRKDIFVELNHKRPILKKVQNPEDENLHTQEVILDSSNIPQCETSCIGVMRLDTSVLVFKEELTEADAVTHTQRFFYDPAQYGHLPEFRFQNHLLNVKELDFTILKEDLDKLEEEKRLKLQQEFEAAAAATNPAGAGKKADPKKDAKKDDKKKGAVVTEDPNVPKENLQIEYATEDMVTENDFLFVDADYTQMKKGKPKLVHDPSILGDKRAIRSAELHSEIKTLKSLNISAAVKMKFNYVPPKVEVKEEVVAEKVEEVPVAKAQKGKKK